MALIDVKTFDLSTHGSSESITNVLIADGAIAQAKITNLVSDLAARAVKASTETISGAWTFSNTVTFTGNINQTGATTLSTGTGAISLNGDVTIASGKTLTLSGAPTQDNHAATKIYVDAIAQSLTIKAAVRVITTAALPAYTRVGNVITADANGALPDIDGVTLVANNRLILNHGAAGEDNGIYVVTAVGDGSNPFVLTRSTDADVSAEVKAGMFAFVTEGTLYADSGWTLITNDSIVLNTTALSFTQFSGAGQIIAGNALTKTGNQLDVNVDNSTIEISSDALRIKALGITNSHISASAAIEWGKIDKTGSSLADLATRSASDLSSGTLADARLSSNVFFVDGTRAVTGNFSQTGTGTFSTGTGTVSLNGAVTAGSTLAVTGIQTNSSGHVEKLRVATTSPVTVATSDYIVVTNLSSAGAVAVNLPSSPTTGTVFIIKDGKGDAGTNNITITPAAGNIDGASTLVINTNYGSVMLEYNGTEWNVVNGFKMGKRLYSVITYNTTAGQTAFPKNGGEPPIPDSEDTMVWIDGRKVFRGANYQYTVDAGGGGITTASQPANRSVEILYWA